MDLSQLYNLTTSELRTEAQRLGALGTEAMGRAELLQVVRRRLDTVQADGFLGKVFGIATETHELAESGRAVQPGSSARAFESEPPATPTRTRTPRSEPTSAERQSVSPAAQQRAFATAIGPRSEPPSESGSDRPKPGAPVGVFSTPSQELRCDEPFPTQTMARILAQQGHYKRSLAIYRALLRESPADAELQREAEAVRQRTRGASAR